MTIDSAVLDLQRRALEHAGYVRRHRSGPSCQTLYGWRQRPGPASRKAVTVAGDGCGYRDWRFQDRTRTTQLRHNYTFVRRPACRPRSTRLDDDPCAPAARTRRVSHMPKYDIARKARTVASACAKSTRATLSAVDMDAIASTAEAARVAHAHNASSRHVRVRLFAPRNELLCGSWIRHRTGG